jgi:hypothetical protein
VNVVALAESAKHFEDRVTAIAREQLDCIVGELEQVKLLETALQRDDCSDEFSQCEGQPMSSPVTCCSELFTSGFERMSIKYGSQWRSLVSERNGP